MAAMDQEAGFDGFDVVLDFAPLGVSGPRCPSSLPAWTGQYGSSQVQFLNKVFLLARCCATSVLNPYSVFTQFWRLRICSSSRSSLTLSCCVPFHCRQARVARRHARLVPFPGSAVPGKVVLARRCATPGAVGVRQCAALPVETLLMQFMDEVLVITADAVVLTIVFPQLLRYVCFLLLLRWLMKPVAIPQVQSCFWCLPVVIASRAVVQTVEITVEFPQLPVFDRTYTFPVVVLRPIVVRQLSDHSVLPVAGYSGRRPL